jgi:hypothetical protein
MSQPGTVYVLGAGASAGLVPFTSGTLAFVRQRYVEFGMYAVESERSPLTDRVIIAPMIDAWKRGESNADDLLVEKIPLSTLELLAQKTWSPRLRNTPPSQYSLLERVAAPSVFFSFNVDGLARAYLSHQHLVFEPHGTVNRRLTESSEFDELLFLSLDGGPSFTRSVLLPGPEPPRITGTSPYLQARTYLRTAPAVVVIGYSFGRFEGRMDDSESFDYLVDDLQKRPCPIVVVDPNADWYASDLEERLGRRCVVSIPLKWDVLSAVMDTLVRPDLNLAVLLDDYSLDMVFAAYLRRLSDQGASSP